MNIWFQHWQPNPKARLRLFCFPYAGGGASIFRTWSENVSAEIEVCPVQLPGRESRLLETPFSHIELLIPPLASVLKPYLDMPYAFFGHSMGALIGFELARHLRHSESDSAPIHLFVSGRRAPQVPDDSPPTYGLPEPGFIEELRRLKGTREEVLENEELLRLMLPLLRADFSLCETYFYTQDRPLACPVSAYGGLQDDEVPCDAVAAWQKQTNASFKLRFFAGDHFFLHKETKMLLHHIQQDLFNYL